MIESLLIKSAEAAKRLGVSRATLHRWVKAGKIACIRIEANSIYFTAEDIDRFISTNRALLRPATVG